MEEVKIANKPIEKVKVSSNDKKYQAYRSNYYKLRYENDPEFKEKMKLKNRELYQRNKQKKIENGTYISRKKGPKVGSKMPRKNTKNDENKENIKPKKTFKYQQFNENLI